MSKVRAVLRSLLPKSIRWPLKRAALRIKYRGKQFYCPVCNSNTNIQFTLGLDFPVLKEKKIVGAGKRDVLCPVCNSSDRVRLIYLFLKHRTQLFTKPHRLLHIAPEPSLQRVFETRKNIRYLTADLNPAEVMEAMDITRINYPDNTFDAILCNHVLEHIQDDIGAMKELLRVLKPEGWAILQVPFSAILENTFEDVSVTAEMEREKVFGQKDHVRIYGKDYSDRLSSAGFTVQIFDWRKDSNSEFHNLRLNINPKEVVYYCQKP
jgi:predicted SAM-dependent methyltransferase